MSHRAPVPYFHVVFTLPAAIADLAYQNKAVIYDLALPDHRVHRYQQNVVVLEKIRESTGPQRPPAKSTPTAAFQL